MLKHNGHDLRAYGSQGQQRLALLALLLAEREADRRVPAGAARDAARRRHERARPRPPQALVELLRASPGQSVITTTDLEHVPGGGDADVTHLSVVERAAAGDGVAE